MTVHLVGAGPGDPDLLTVKAARLLSTANVVVHDARHERDLVRRLAVGKPLQDVRSILEQVVAEVHDEELRG